MAIYQRARVFQKIFSEIDVDIIPLKFVKEITCHLENGEAITFARTDIDLDDETSLEEVIKDLDFFDELSDLKILIDFERIEQVVNIEVRRLLEGQNDQSNSSM